MWDMTTKTFITAAEAYCDLIETFGRYEVTDFLDEVHLHLAALYHAALSLPDVEPMDLHLENPIPHNQTYRLFDDISAYLGAPDRYRLIMEPYELEEEATKAIYPGSLADDLVDTYRDVKNGLLLWSEADALTRQEVIWGWRCNFQIHWARHAAGALYVLAYRLNLEPDDPL